MKGECAATSSGSGIDEAPRMTAAEADARFAALVAEHRAAKGRRAAAAPRSDARRDRDATPTTLVVVIVFCLGVASGAWTSRKPLLAVLVGVPLILIASHFVRRRSRVVHDD